MEKKLEDARSAVCTVKSPAAGKIVNETQQERSNSFDKSLRIGSTVPLEYEAGESGQSWTPPQ